MTTTKRRAKRDIESPSDDLLPRDKALRRADAILRAMLNSPPDPYTPKPKPKQRAKK